MRRTTVGWLACLLAVIPIACEQSPERSEVTEASPAVVASEASLEDGAIDKAIRLHQQGSYESARAMLRAAAEEARLGADSASLARATTWLGLGYWRQGNYQEARRLGEEALAIKTAANLTSQLFRSYNALGLLAWDEARIEDAARYFQVALEAAESVGDELGSATAAGNLALVHTDLADFDGAEAGFSAMREAGHRLGDVRVEANALTNHGMLDVRVGRSIEALPKLTEALRLHRSIDQAAGEENALGQLGTAFAAMGELGKAHAYYDSALAVAKRHGLKDAEAQDLEVMAELYRSSGDAHRALALFREAGRLNSDLGAEFETAKNARSEAEILAELGDLQGALDEASGALEILRASGDELEILKGLVTLADLMVRAQQNEQARDAIAEARSIAERLSIPVAFREVALADARLADHRADSPAVLQVLSDPRAELEGSGYQAEWEAAFLRSRALSRLGRRAEAIEAGYRSLAAVERRRGSFASGTLRHSYTLSRMEVFQQLITMLVAAGRLEEALAVSDGARGRALREQLPTMDTTGARTNPAVRDLSESEQLLRRIEKLRESSDDPFYGAEPSTARELRRRLTEAQSQYEALLAEAAEQNPGEASLLGGSPVDVTSVQAALEPGEVLLEYLVGPESVFIFVLDTDSLRVTTSSVTPENLRRRVRLVREYLGQPREERRLPAVLDDLYRILVEPVAELGSLREAKRLVVVPHDVLAYLPFAALRDPGTGRFLVEDHSTLYLPSASALPVVRRNTRGKEGAGPTPSVHTFAPFPRALPASRSEARRVAGLFPGGVSSFGAAATEGALRRALSEVDVVHVATHGFMNPWNPMFSRVDLAPGDPEVGPDDGRLELHEVLALPVRASLVFLSGCETGVGSAWSTTFDAGQDYTTLAQTFLLAGARNVVSTLWRLEDQSAQVFADSFYEALSSRGPVEALATAQRALIADERFGSPHHWATYQVSGSGT